MTANFEFAVEKTLRLEDSHLSGKITVDDGGKTRFGISQLAYPDEHLIYELPVDEALERAKELYHRDYWEVCHLDDFDHQLLSWKVFDNAVNDGVLKSGKLLQQSINVLTHSALVLDGKIGALTVSAANSMDGTMLLDKLRDLQEAHHRHLAENRPDIYGEYLEGWLNRDRA